MRSFILICIVCCAWSNGLYGEPSLVEDELLDQGQVRMMAPTETMISPPSSSDNSGEIIFEEDFDPYKLPVEPTSSLIKKRKAIEEAAVAYALAQKNLNQVVAENEIDSENSDVKKFEDWKAKLNEAVIQYENALNRLKEAELIYLEEVGAFEEEKFHDLPEGEPVEEGSE